MDHLDGALDGLVSQALHSQPQPTRAAIGAFDVRSVLQERQRALEARCDQVSRRWEQLSTSTPPPAFYAQPMHQPPQPPPSQSRPPSNTPAQPPPPQPRQPEPSLAAEPAPATVQAAIVPAPAPAPAPTPAPEYSGPATPARSAKRRSMEQSERQATPPQGSERRAGAEAMVMRALQKKVERIMAAMDPPPPPPPLEPPLGQSALQLLPQAAAEALEPEFATLATALVAQLDALHEALGAQRQQMRQGYQETIATLRRSHATAQHAAQQQQRDHAEALRAEQQRTAELSAELGSTVQERVQAATAPLRQDLASLELRNESLSHELERQRQLSERLTEDLSLLRDEKRAALEQLSSQQHEATTRQEYEMYRERSRLEAQAKQLQEQGEYNVLQARLGAATELEGVKAEHARQLSELRGKCMALEAEVAEAARREAAARREGEEKAEAVRQAAEAQLKAEAEQRSRQLLESRLGEAAEQARREREGAQRGLRAQHEAELAAARRAADGRCDELQAVIVAQQAQIEQLQQGRRAILAAAGAPPPTDAVGLAVVGGGVTTALALPVAAAPAAEPPPTDREAMRRVLAGALGEGAYAAAAGASQPSCASAAAVAAAAAVGSPPGEARGPPGTEATAQLLAQASEEETATDAVTALPASAEEGAGGAGDDDACANGCTDSISSRLEMLLRLGNMTVAEPLVPPTPASVADAGEADAAHGFTITSPLKSASGAHRTRQPPPQPPPQPPSRGVPTRSAGATSACAAAAQAATAAVRRAGAASSPAPGRGGGGRSYTDLLDEYIVRSASKAAPTPGRRRAAG